MSRRFDDLFDPSDGAHGHPPGTGGATPGSGADAPPPDTEPGDGRWEELVDRFYADRAVNPRVPQSARIWNYWLGGKDNFPADCKAGDRVARILPEIRDAALHDRAFLRRAVQYLVQEAGIRQFLDIGTGMPTVDNTHELAQRAAPDARIVYVDNDPLVLAHARALLISAPEGACDYLDADVRDVDGLLSASGQILDLDRPVAVLMLGVLDHVTDDAEASSIVGELMRAFTPGSHLVIAHPTAELHGDRVHQALRLVEEAGGTPVCARTPEQIAMLFGGLEVLEPGVVSCSRWRPDHGPWRPPDEVLQWCGVARKPYQLHRSGRAA